MGLNWFPAIFCFFMFVCSAARADGEIGIFFIAPAIAPINALIFAPIALLSGMNGRLLQAAGLYALLAFILDWLQIADWYHPFARTLYGWTHIPFFDLALLSILGVIALYYFVRDRSVPIGLMRPLPTRKIIFGTSFSFGAIAIWWLGTYLVMQGDLLTQLSKSTSIAFFILWLLIIPICGFWCAYRLFRFGRILPAANS